MRLTEPHRTYVSILKVSYILHGEPVINRRVIMKQNLTEGVYCYIL
jgi:hypothetical protein